MPTGIPFDDGLAGLGAARADVLAEVRPLDPVQVRFAPGPGRWSIAQVVEHLVLVDEAALRGLSLPRRGERLFRHSVAGWLSLHQMLDFLAFHLRHHHRQVRSIRRAAGFPRG